MDAPRLVFRNFTACIKIDGKPLTIYAPEYSEETKTAIGWVASQPGVEYTIAWRRLEDVESDVKADIYLDGKTDVRAGSGGFLRRESDLSTWHDRSGVRVGPTTLRPFVFAPLQTTDDPELLANSSSPQQPGTIQLDIRRVVADEGHSQRLFGPDQPSNSKLGSQRTITAAKYVKLRPYMENEGPYVSFVFQYRSAEILQAMGVMTRTEGNKRRRNDSEELNVGDEPADADGSDVEQAEAEIAALEASLKARKDALAAKKRVKREPGEPQHQKIKREEALPSNRLRTRGEVIDLTSD